MRFYTEGLKMNSEYWMCDKILEQSAYKIINRKIKQTNNGSKNMNFISIQVLYNDPFIYIYL
jgi:hypothetical protein